MKTFIINLFLLPALIAGLGLIPAGRVTAQTLTTLYSFTETSGPSSTNSDGANPQAGLILSGTTLYGTAYWGGSSGKGTVFAVNIFGGGFTTLHTFAVDPSDGAYPAAGLILSGNTLYGTASLEGSVGNNGTVFAVHTDGTGFTNLYNFDDGWDLLAGLILSGNTLYGTADQGGSSDNGTVFKVNTDGTGFTTLYSFTNGDDGAHPDAGLILSGNTLYGTTYWGGSEGDGTVFAVNTNGTGFTTLYSFSGSDGVNPQAGLILSVTTLYGTTVNGGSSGYGTVFSLSLLTIIRSGANVVVSWPANVVGFTLQSTTNLNPPIVWSPVSPVPTVVNGQNTVTNPASGTRKFYRLSK